MKKFRNLICIMFVLILGIFFVGCKTPEDPNNGTPPVTTPATSGTTSESGTSAESGTTPESGNTPEIEEPTEVTLSLSDAKSMVVDSLESMTEKTQLNVNRLNSSPSTVGNRNIFIKLGNTQLLFEGDFDYADTIEGYVHRTTENWDKYSLESGEKKGYFDGENAYSKYEDNYTKESFLESYFGVILYSVDCIYVDLLFIEDAWVSIYENTATRTKKDYGFALTLNVDMSKYVDYVMAKSEEYGLGAEGLIGEGDYKERNKQEGSVELIVRFDKFLNIIGLDMTVVSLGSSGNGDVDFFETNFYLDKYNEEITAPEWFDASDYE